MFAYLYSKAYNEVQCYYPGFKLGTINLVAFPTGGYFLTSNLLQLSGVTNPTLLTSCKVAGAVMAFFALGDITGEERFKITAPINQRKIQEIIIQSSRERKEKSMLLWKTTEDPAGAGCTPDEVYNTRQLAKIHSIEYVPGDQTPSDKQYDLIKIQGHGFFHKIIMAPNIHFDMNSHNLFSVIKTRIKPGGIISIESCSAGKKLCRNMAQAISEACPQATVYAPTVEFSGKNIRYNENGVPSFIKDGVNITAIYRNGIKQYK